MEKKSEKSEATQSCPTLCNPMDCSLPGSSIHGIPQVRILEWVAISFSNDESEKWKWSRSVVSDSQRPHGLQPTRLLRPWDSPSKSTGVGCHCLANGKRSHPFFGWSSISWALKIALLPLLKSSSFFHSCARNRVFAKPILNLIQATGSGTWDDVKQPTSRGWIKAIQSVYDRIRSIQLPCDDSASYQLLGSVKR